MFQTYFYSVKMLHWLKTANEKNVKSGLSDTGKCPTPEKQKLTEKLNEVVDIKYVQHFGSIGKNEKEKNIHIIMLKLGDMQLNVDLNLFHVLKLL